MLIHLKLFAILRERAGFSDRPLEVPALSNVSQLREMLARRHPELEDLLRRSAIAVNQSYASPEQVLDDNDEVALIPPVSGGHDDGT